MTDGQRSYLRKETAVAVAINGAFSALFAWLAFGGRAATAQEVASDALPQSFAIALMTTLVPTLITRKRLRAGAVAPLSRANRLPGNLLLRALLVGALAALVGGALHWFVVRPLGPETWRFELLLPYKVAYGALLALAIAPPILRRALADLPNTGDVR